MSAQEPLSRNSLVWLLVSQLMLLLPHLQRSPVWLLAIWLACACWRWQIFRGVWGLPHWIIKLPLILGCSAGLIASYGGKVGPEGAVALLVVGVSLKLIELARRRDAYLLIFLGYLVALAAFLFDQSLIATLYILFAITLLTGALVAVHQPARQRWSPHSVRVSAKLVLQAIPLMVVLFLIFPRLGPLWQVSMPGGKAKTGVSEVMSPGDITQLGRSAELAFRVEFEGEPPPKDQLYWRGIVLNQFDGRSWKPSSLNGWPMGADQKQRIQSGIVDLSYTVYLEATQQPWLFAIRTPISDDPRIAHTADLRLALTAPLAERMAYSVSSYTEYAAAEQLRGWRQRALALPNGGNPESRALAREWKIERLEPLQIVNRVLRRFRQQPYVYTLSPPPLGRDSIDDFLFETQRGFCGHYASAFTYLMRLAGIPARVVVGYQGGEVNPLSRAVLVHQYDAHAWSEVWLDGQGWVRVDPTAAVAPERIEQGLEAVLSAEELAESALTSPLRYRNVQWLNQLRLRLDALNHGFTRWVLQYRGERQIELLHKLLGRIDPLRIAVLLGVAVGFSIVIFLILDGLRPRKRRSAEERRYNRFCQRMARKGFVRRAGEGPLDFAARVSAAKPELSTEVELATERFIADSYQPRF